MARSSEAAQERDAVKRRRYDHRSGAEAEQAQHGPPPEETRCRRPALPTLRGVNEHEREQRAADQHVDIERGVRERPVERDEAGGPGDADHNGEPERD